MLLFDGSSGVFVVLPGMGQAAMLASNVQHRPTCFRKGWTAQTRMNTRFVQPPNLIRRFRITRMQVCAHTRTRALQRISYLCWEGWDVGQDKQRRGFQPSNLSDNIGQGWDRDKTDREGRQVWGKISERGNHGK